MVTAAVAWAAIDWVSAASLATAAATLVLAVATFAAVRSANRTARAAEQALQINLRPLLMTARLNDEPQVAMWLDRHFARLEGGRASFEVVDGRIYLALPLRNVGAGIAVLLGGDIRVGLQRSVVPYRDPATFRPLTRDLYIAPGDIGYWQTALRDASDTGYDEILAGIRTEEHFTIDLLYSDDEGGQRTISRFTIASKGEGVRYAQVAKHWVLDRADPHDT
jgi:hypothetical protein